MVPAPNPMVEVMLPVGRFMVTFPLTARELDEAEKLRIPLAVPVIVPIETDAHAALYPLGIVTVRLLAPSPTKTLSPATGTDAPDAPPEVADQVVVTFQFPFAMAYLEAALAVEAPPINTNKRARCGILEGTRVMEA